MAEPVDYFMQGVGLGHRSRSIRNQEEQFRTNLAERARQANEQLDLRKRQVDSQISRDNLYIKKLDFDLATSEIEANRETAELKLLSDYQASLESFSLNSPESTLPFPPQGLTGANLQAALSLHQRIATAQEANIDYKLAQQEKDNVLDLMSNYNLPRNYLSLPLEQQNIVFTNAENNRINQTAREIEARFRVDPLAVNAAGIDAMNFVNQNGKLNELAYENAISKLSPLKETSRQTYPSGGEARTFIPSDIIKTKSVTADLSRIRSDRSKLEASVTKRRQSLTDEGYEPQEVEDIISQEYPPDFQSGNTSLRKGDEIADTNGNVYVYAGGDPQNKNNWIKAR